MDFDKIGDFLVCLSSSIVDIKEIKIVILVVKMNVDLDVEMKVVVIEVIKDNIRNDFFFFEGSFERKRLVGLLDMWSFNLEG